MPGNEITAKHHQTFEGIRQVNDFGQEFWPARTLGKVLEYAEYRKRGQPMNLRIKDFVREK